MTKETLISKTKNDLLKIAQRLGLRGVTTLRKDQLATKIVKAKQQKKIASSPKKKSAGVFASVKKAASNAADMVRRRAIRKRKPVPPTKPPPPKIARKRKTSTADIKDKPVTAKDAAAVAAHKFDTTPKAKEPKRRFADEALGELPDSYGTTRLFLIARDPGWLYAYWDMTGQQMADARKCASDGRLVLRLFEKNHSKPLQELTLHHDSRNWYISGVRSSTTYSTQIGYWRQDGHFHIINQSRETITPSAVVSADTTAQFATIPIDVPYEELISIIRSYGQSGEQLAEALHRIQAQGAPLPFKVGVEVGPWTTEQATALEQELGGDILRRTQMGSFEISEWLRRRLLEELGMSSGMFSPGGASWSAAPGAGKGFWFAVNAELIIYGATEPGAKVTVDGKPITLKDDGTFHFHYSFPDGKYHLPVVAVSATGDDQRAVELDFERKTKTLGDVGTVKPAVKRSKPA